MKLLENPLLVTHRRLTLRAGMLPPALIAGLIGASLLAGLIAALADLKTFHFATKQAAGYAFYAWVVGIELLLTALGGFAHIWQRLTEDRKAGLWESNRLTPLRPSELVLGYLLGAPLREAIMGGILAVFGLIIVLASGAPLLVWVLSQMLIVTTVCLLWLFALVIGLVIDRAMIPIMIVGTLLLIQGASYAGPSLSVTSYLVPVSTLARLFSDAGPTSHWQVEASLFGLVVHPLILTLLVQASLGFLLWRGAVRHTSNPFSGFLSRAESLALFTLLVLLQHGLLWDGAPDTADYSRLGLPAAARCLLTSHGNRSVMLLATQVGTVILGVVMLGLLSPPPERVRVAALRARGQYTRIVQGHSAVLLGVAFACVVGLAYATHLPHCSAERYGKILAILITNLAALFVIVPALLDLCRLTFRRRAEGFFALALFAVCFLPFILAGVFWRGSLVQWSFLAPGIIVLAQSSGPDVDRLFLIVAGQLALTAVVAIVWHTVWLQFLKRAA